MDPDIEDGREREHERAEHSRSQNPQRDLPYCLLCPIVLFIVLAVTSIVLGVYYGVYHKNK